MLGHPLPDQDMRLMRTSVTAPRDLHYNIFIKPMQTEKTNKKEWILHIDGDSFFASCEVSRRPDLFGKPVVVGEERGIATALTYPAKALGLKRGDPVFMIKRDYPSVTILSSHFELYRKFAYNLATILKPEVKEFEAYSIDECFATIVGTQEEVVAKVTALKNEIQRKLGITYSFGVSTTKTLAKVASKKNKPNGLCFLMGKQEIQDALAHTSVESIWGIGWAGAKRMRRHKIITALDFVNSDPSVVLGSSFNKTFNATFEELCGIKHFQVGTLNPHKKSIQSTRTFLQKSSDKKILYGELSRNVEVACSEMRKDGLLTNRVYFFIQPKIKGEKYVQKMFDLPNYTNSDMAIMKCIEQAFDESLELGNTVFKKTGVMVMNLASYDELEQDLFNHVEYTLKEESKLTNLVDSLRNKYGFGVIALASSLEQNNKRRTDYVRRHKTDIYESGLPYPFLGIIN